MYNAFVAKVFELNLENDIHTHPKLDVCAFIILESPADLIHSGPGTL